MMAQDEFLNYVLEKVNNFPEISVEDIEDWLQEDSNSIKNREKFRNDLSLQVFCEVPISNQNVLKNKADIGLDSTFNNAQINNIVAKYEKYSSSAFPDNLDQILSLTDNITEGDKTLSPVCLEQTCTDDSRGNFKNTARITDSNFNNNHFVVNEQLQNNIFDISTEESYSKLSTSIDFSKIVPASIIEQMSTQQLTKNHETDTNFCKNLKDNCINNYVKVENLTEHHYVQIIPNNYNVEDKGIKLVIKKNQPLNIKHIKKQSTKGKITYSDTFHTNQIIPVDSNTKYHLEVVTRALAAVNITDDMLQCTRTEDNQKLWTCHMPDCDSVYRKLCQIKEHLLIHFGLRPFQCDFKNCKWAFSSIFKLKRHQKSHEKVKEFICPEPSCQRRFSNSTNLTIHKKIHVQTNKYKCPMSNCKSSFSVQKTLDQHMRNEHGEKYAPIVCLYPGCNKRFYGNSAFKSHQRVHNYAQEDVTCTWPGCGKVFDIPSRLRYHMMSHTGERTYQCPYCNRSFPTASKLLRHEISHRSERQFICDSPGCGKSFRRKDHLTMHYLIHNRDRERYRCDYCDSTFIARASIKIHVRKHLNGHFEKKKKRHQRRRKVKKNLTNAEDDQYCARTQPFVHLNKSSKRKLSTDEKNAKLKTNKVKGLRSEKENVAPLLKVQNNNSAHLFATSPSNKEDFSPINEDIASTAFGEDYPSSNFYSSDNSLLNEELLPIYIQENFEVPECQIYNNSLDDNSMQDILGL